MMWRRRIGLLRPPPFPQLGYNRRAARRSRHRPRLLLRRLSACRHRCGLLCPPVFQHRHRRSRRFAFPLRRPRILRYLALLFRRSRRRRRCRCHSGVCCVSLLLGATRFVLRERLRTRSLAFRHPLRLVRQQLRCGRIGGCGRGGCSPRPCPRHRDSVERDYRRVVTRLALPRVQQRRVSTPVRRAPHVLVAVQAGALSPAGVRCQVVRDDRVEAPHAACRAHDEVRFELAASKATHADEVNRPAIRARRRRVASPTVLQQQRTPAACDAARLALMRAVKTHCLFAHAARSPRTCIKSCFAAVTGAARDEECSLQRRRCVRQRKCLALSSVARVRVLQKTRCVLLSLRTTRWEEGQHRRHLVGKVLLNTTISRL